MKIKIAPSILSANRKRLQAEVKKIEKYAELLHIDIMDGIFVPPVTFSADEIKAIKTKLPKDVHLMVEHPLKFIDEFINAGAASITIHEECDDDIEETIAAIRRHGIKVGITIKPITPLSNLIAYIEHVDMALIMSVNPGYAGQKFMPEVLVKVAELRRLKPALDIEIDGGIDKKTIKLAHKAGANVFVAGSSIFGAGDPVKAIKELRSALQ